MRYLMILVLVASIASRPGIIEAMNLVFYFGKMGIHNQQLRTINDIQ